MADIIKLIGSFVMFSGALGMMVFTDSFQRFHAAGKVGLFGLALLILGDAISFRELTGEWNFISYIGLAILLFTGPFASHILARAVYQSRKKPRA